MQMFYERQYLTPFLPLLPMEEVAQARVKVRELGMLT